jgi:dTDP-4-dehydrorhamnose reductase
MLLLLGGDSELGAATFRDLKQQGIAVQATTRRRELISPDRPYFDILDSLDDWEPPVETRAACIFLAVSRLQDCEKNPVAAARVNVTQSLRLIERLLAKGIYVLFLSSNQVFNGEQPNVSEDTPFSPVSIYGQLKADIEIFIRERVARAAQIGVLRLSKVLDSKSSIIGDWIRSLSNGRPIRAFVDMKVAPVPVEIVSKAIGALLTDMSTGVFQLSGPLDVRYAEVGHYLAQELNVDPGLVETVSASLLGLPNGSTPHNTTLDSSVLREKFGIVVPDVWKILSMFLEIERDQLANAQPFGAKLIKRDDLSEVVDGVYYSSYSLPLVDAELIAFLKQAAAKSTLRRARFCAHLSPGDKQHDMLIVSHRESYVMPHRHMTKSETFLILEGFAEIIFFGESGEVEKIVKMGPPSSGRPFFYRMPPRKFHSISIETELLVFVENTTGPFDLGDREHAAWAPDHKDTGGGIAFIASIVEKSA